MDTISALAKAHGLKVIEDNAQAIGASYKGKPTGSFGDVACLSFYPTKNLGAAGDAGMVVTKDAELFERLKTLRAHGMKRRYYHDELGVNSRLDEIQAAVLVTKFPHLLEWTRKRQAAAKLYDRALNGCPGIITPKLSFGNAAASEATIGHVWHQYTIRVTAGPSVLASTARDTVAQELASRGVGSMCYYPVPLHVQQAFMHLGYKLGDFPISEKLADEVLSIPIYAELTADQIAYVSDSLREIMSSVFALTMPVPVTPPVLTI
jgi:dTDP-4-amino-4,6-dideoxygalactose transaminase